MVHINLLPWRETQRRTHNRQTMIGCAVTLVAAVLVVVLAKFTIDGRMQHQQDRNVYLQAQIDALSKVLSEIEDIKGKRDQLLARMQVIQTLQMNRSQIVHVFDDLVTKLPKGVYYDSIQKTAGNLKIDGKAQSNGRVSALMRNLDSSDWFDNTSLTVVDVIDQSAVLVSKFNLEVKEASDSIENIE
jgi:type IV pilus assembly protein PilN